jgi:hypothetical protein
MNMSSDSRLPGTVPFVSQPGLALASYQVSSTR